MTTPTRAALAGLGTTLATEEPSAGQRAVDAVTGWLHRHTGRRGFLVRAGLVGAALASDPIGYVLKPGTAYASVCGPGASCSSGWTVFCATINQGVNACPPGSIAAGWWKADGASLCGGRARYIVDCNATCTHCSTPGVRPGICSSSCWSCSCRCGPSASCDQRRVCCNAFRYGQCNTQVRQVGGVHCRVVSCTPPWKFANCTTSSATDNRTRDHSSDQLPTSYSPIVARYVAIGENGSVLGASVHREFAVAGGRAQLYQRGHMSWSSATGAREVVGATYLRYNALGAEGGVLGFPTSYRATTSDGRGIAQSFQRGRISYHPYTGAFETRGVVRDRYVREGAETGRLGYPLTGEYRPADGKGRINTFYKGRIVADPAGHTFVQLGPVSTRYVALAGPAGPLGYPTSDQVAVPGGGQRASFVRGRISYHPYTGAFETRGVIRDRYVREGAETGRLGYPLSGESRPPDGLGRVSAFYKGRIVADPAGRTFVLLGAVSHRYAALAGPGGVLGYPTSDQAAVPGGGYRATFAHGRISWSAATGAFEVRAALNVAYARVGYETGKLGYPLAGQQVATDGRGRVSRFQRGRISAKATGAAFSTRGPIATRYVEIGAERSLLGYPTADEVISGRLRTSRFEHGRITYDEVSGKVTVLVG